MNSLLMRFLLKFHALQGKLTSICEKNKFILELKKNAKSNISNHLKIGKNTTYLISDDAIISFGTHIDIRNNCNFVAGKNAAMIIENNVFMNNSCSVNCLEKITIGENTLFGEGVKLYDHNHQYSDQKIEHQKFTTAPINIGKSCWLGSNVIVLKGVNIGDNSIIGAGCIIYKDIPANSLVTNNQELNIKTL